MLLACNDFQVIQESEYIEQQIDIFAVQTPPPSADVVFVVDGSGSMSDNWSTVYAQLVDLSQTLQAINVPLRVTTISADPTIQFTPTWLDTTDTNFYWNLVAQVQHIQSFNGVKEDGLDASFQFSFTYRDQLNEASDLYFVFISDEDDQSGIDTTLWSDAMAAFKPPGLNVMSGAIVETGKGCGDIPGLRYIEVADAVVDFCDVDWKPVLAPLQNRTAPPTNTFVLSSVPDIDTIEVWVTPSYTDLWTYDAATNSVTISEPLYDTSTVVVTYWPPND